MFLNNDSLLTGSLTCPFFAGWSCHDQGRIVFILNIFKLISSNSNPLLAILLRKKKERINEREKGGCTTLGKWEYMPYIRKQN